MAAGARRIAFFTVICLLPAYWFISQSSENAQAGSAMQATESPVAKLASLSWMAGQWVRTQGKDDLEESWSGPTHDSLMGMFRWVKDGKVWMFEFMTITVEGDEIVFRLRHFDRSLKPWEPQDAPLTYKMKSLSGDEVVFEHPEKNDPKRFVYRRPGKDKFVVRLESEKDGKLSGSEFEFRRKQ